MKYKLSILAFFLIMITLTSSATVTPSFKQLQKKKTKVINRIPENIVVSNEKLASPPVSLASLSVDLEGNK